MHLRHHIGRYDDVRCFEVSIVQGKFKFCRKILITFVGNITCDLNLNRVQYVLRFISQTDNYILSKYEEYLVLSSIY